MQTKNKVILIIAVLLNLILCNLNVNAKEFDITALEISVDKKNKIIIGRGSVEAIDNEGKIIKGDKITYDESKRYLLAEGSVEIIDSKGNILTTDKAMYDKIKDIIFSYKNSKLILEEGYNISSNAITYNNAEQIISSAKNSIFTDTDGNTGMVTMFQYQINKNLFSSVGNIKIIDADKNKYFFKELHVDTKKQEMVGSDISVFLDQEKFGLSKKSDPRFVANDILMSENKSNFSKGVFTTCKKRGDKCPPWMLQAKKIIHDKIKKTIYYENATLKVYGVPIFYFPRFYHPDPTVKRQSGFLTPFFTQSSNTGTGIGLPYFWAISHDKDLTFAPKISPNENILFLNEYRQAFRNGFMILDTSYTSGLKSTSETMTAGSRNHIFAELNLSFAEDDSYQNNLFLKLQKTSNDNYFKVHDINTALVDSENSNLDNHLVYQFSKDNTYVNLSANVYENLESTDDRYEYILPNMMFGKTFFGENFGILDFRSNVFYKNFDADKHITVLNNDITWSPSSYVSKNGFVNTLEGIINNRNYEARNTTDFKTTGTVNELNSVLSFKSSLPMKKEGVNSSKIVSPNFMLRYAPGHMRDLSKADTTLNYANLFSTNKTSDIEDGLSAILGFDFKINKKNKDNLEKEKFSISMGQVFNHKENEDIPSKSSLDQKMSDVVGEINYNFSEIGSIDYKFSIDHNFNELNYNQISTNLNFGKFSFNVDYLEEQNHIGNDNYMKPGISLNFNENNKLSLSTKKNFTTDSTEYYDVNYQYINDCLKAGLVYRREFYEDDSLEPKDSLMFMISFIPFGGATTPSVLGQ